MSAARSGNSGLAFPPRRITVNLAPADLRKAGASLDLAIAVGILLGSEQARASGRWAFIGELSLGGELRAVPGILPMVAALVRRGASRVVVPAEAAAEARLADRVEAHPADGLDRRRRHPPAERRETAPADRDPDPRRARVVRTAERLTGGTCQRKRPGRRRARPGGRPRPGARSAGARDRAGRRSRDPADRATRLGQDAPRPDDPAPPAATRRRRGQGRLGHRVGRRRWPARRARPDAGRSGRPTTRSATPACSAAVHAWLPAR